MAGKKQGRSGVGEDELIGLVRVSKDIREIPLARRAGGI